MTDPTMQAAESRHLDPPEPRILVGTCEVEWTITLTVEVDEDGHVSWRFPDRCERELFALAQKELARIEAQEQE